MAPFQLKQLASRVKQLYFALQKYTTPVRFGDALSSASLFTTVDGKPVLSFRPPLFVPVVLNVSARSNVQASCPDADRLTGRQPGTHTFP